MTILIRRACLSVACLLALTCHTSQAVAAEMSRDEAQIQINDGLMSVSLDQAPLLEVLQIIANQTKIHIELDASADRLITKKFNDLKFEEGLRRLLRPYNHVIVYKKSGSPAEIELMEKIVIVGNPEDRGRPRSVVNLAGVGENVSPDGNPNVQIEPAPETTLAFYAKQLQAEDPDTRRDSVIDMAEKYNIEALRLLEGVLLNDTNNEVRITVAETIGSMASEKGIPALAKALNDPDDGVRNAVLEALGVIGTPAVLPSLRAALNDSNEDIRSKASSLIEGIPGDQ